MIEVVLVSETFLPTLERMRWLILFSLFSVYASAQEPENGDYFFVLEGDTIKGYYEDFKIENGKFTQHITTSR